MIKKTLFLLLFFTHVFGADPIDLSQYEKSLYSEYGEDGILAKLFLLFPPAQKTCIHLGASDGFKDNCSYLLRLQNWKGVLVDRKNEHPGIHLHKAFITAENVNTLLQTFNAPLDADLLVMNLHFNGFHIWNALDATYRPSIVVVKYNGTLDPEKDQVVKYRFSYAGDHTDYFGASIQSFYELGKSKGYSLVYAEKAGAYLFFVRNDLLVNQQFQHMNEPEKLFRKAIKKYQPDPKAREYTTYKGLS